MKVPLLDLKKQYDTIRQEVLHAVEEIFESQHFILGPHVEDLERTVAEYCHANHAVGVSSGTDALLISLMAAGIGPGDRVITTPYTFLATAGAISRLGAIPVFADVEPDTLNISVDEVARCIDRMDRESRSKLKCILPVHMYGQCVDMLPLLQLAKEYSLKEYSLMVIEDAAQAIGASCGDKRAGSMGTFGCFSFYPSKNLGAYGDGGMVTTNSREQYDILRTLRDHGQHPKYIYQRIGGNFRLDALQAAIVAVKLKYLDGWTHARQKKAKIYRSLLTDAGLDGLIMLPAEAFGRHVYNYYVIRVSSDRDGLRRALEQAGIGTDIYYPLPLHLQECFSDLGYSSGDFPVAERASREILALPIYPELTDDQQAYVSEQIKAYYR